MIWSKGVRARKPWRCGSCGSPIKPGDLHVRITASPNDNDVGNTSWFSERECAPCAVRYDRGHLIVETFILQEPITKTDQPITKTDTTPNT